MKKADMREAILKELVSSNAGILRVYGVSFGVGYDLVIDLEFKNVDMNIHAHATNKSWALPGYLRPDNPQYKYTGSNDRYQYRVINYWKTKDALDEYLSRFQKPELEEFYNKVVKH